MAKPRTACRLGGDLVGDELPDLVATVPFYAANAPWGGAVFLVAGPASTGGSLPDVATSTILGASSTEGVLWHSTTSDVHGDGADDLIVSREVSYSDVPTEEFGASVFFGPIAGAMLVTGDDARLKGWDFNREGCEELDDAGDVDGDGITDLVLGAPSYNNGTYDAVGAAYVVSGASLHGAVDLLFAMTRVEGRVGSDRVGFSVAGVGDTDGNGHDDVLVGAPYVNQPVEDGGQALLFRGPMSGVHLVGDIDTSFAPGQTVALLGENVAGGHDVTGDGVSDLLFLGSGMDAAVEQGGMAQILPLGDLQLRAETGVQLIGGGPEAPQKTCLGPEASESPACVFRSRDSGPVNRRTRAYAGRATRTSRGFQIHGLIGPWIDVDASVAHRSTLPSLTLAHDPMHLMAPTVGGRSAPSELMGRGKRRYR